MPPAVNIKHATTLHYKTLLTYLLPFHLKITMSGKGAKGLSGSGKGELEIPSKYGVCFYSFAQLSCISTATSTGYRCAVASSRNTFFAV